MVKDTLSAAAQDPIEQARSRWLARYGQGESPIAAWQASASGRAPTLAFTALVQDPALLDRIDSRVARHLVSDAKKFTQSIDGAAFPDTHPVVTLVPVVKARVMEWEQSGARYTVEADVGVATMGASMSEDALASFCMRAMQMYPGYSERVGRMAVTVLTAAGSDGIETIRPAWARMLAYEGARYAARCARGVVKEPPLPKEDRMAAVATAQAWAACHDGDLLRVPYSMGIGTPAMQAVTLALDAASLSEIALGLPGREAAPGYDIWEDSEEMHAFAAVAIDPTVINRLTLEQAEAVCSGATRYAIQARDASSQTMQPAPGALPANVSIARVIASARTALPNGVKPRRTRRIAPVRAAGQQRRDHVESQAEPQWVPAPKQAPAARRSLMERPVWGGVEARR